MFRLIAITIMSFYLSNAWADCDIVSKFHINVNVKPVQYDYSKASSEIKQIPNVKGDNRTQYLLGAYLPTLSIGLNYQTMRESRLLNTCNKVVSMNVEVTLDSSIFIAREIQPFSCTLNRTIDHENKHFTFEKESIKVGVDYLQSNLEPLFSQKVYASQEQYAKYLKGQLELVQSTALKLMSNHSASRHSAIDTFQNYEKESDMCSTTEQIMVSKSILFL